MRRKNGGSARISVVLRAMRETMIASVGNSFEIENRR